MWRRGERSPQEQHHQSPLQEERGERREMGGGSERGREGAKGKTQKEKSGGEWRTNREEGIRKY